MAQGATQVGKVTRRAQEKGIPPMFPGERTAGSKARNVAWPCDACTWLRQYLFWRAGDSSTFVPAHHDPDRDGMSRGRNPKRRNRRFKWVSHSIAIGSIVL